MSIWALARSTRQGVLLQHFPEISSIGETYAALGNDMQHGQKTFDICEHIQIIGVRDLPLRDMISLGAWRMGLGCSGEIPPSSSPSPSSSAPF